LPLRLLLPLRSLPDVEPLRFEGCDDALLLGCWDGFVEGVLLGC
jgi:hypothetical protein